MTRFNVVFFCLFISNFLFVACGEEDNTPGDPPPPACQANCTDNDATPENVYSVNGVEISESELRAFCTRKADISLLPEGISYASLRNLCEIAGMPMVDPPPTDPCAGYEYLAGMWDCPAVDCNVNLQVEDGLCVMRCLQDNAPIRIGDNLKIAPDRKSFEYCIEVYDGFDCFTCTRPE
ncbi:MAG: hypothetical protein COU35_03575 [Candidatus Magasanikbacteria bacterium CG10_big_fil_rev_8_21_14_0_10_47_10]|uniref:Uncharacterized protein n=1 Tax=Candidatus Magasanikbacteria bacterium CG10_big_fil_rev_8_21_14_0_10_47_10 TaxID=1974652 RepID=A0A2H0TS27_9BACT|nr:MAG: hypothetical protein COU35_03575 [Candidatus Magasanikbacteria bacterium CG10_big_fil_rev_8_21_14_0_10_47_10]